MPITKTVTKTDGGDNGEKTTVLTQSTYDFMKRFVQVILPAFSSLYFGLSQMYNLPGGEEVVGSCALLATFLGTVIGISSKRYNESGAANDGELVVTEDGGGASGFLLSLDGDPELLADKSRISFRVKRVQSE